MVRRISDTFLDAESASTFLIGNRGTVSVHDPSQKPEPVFNLLPAPACVLLFASVAAAGQVPDPPPQPEKEKPQELPKYEETVIVTAAKIEQLLVNAPAAVTVLSGAALENAPGQNVADLLRAVPGLNVAQISVRDINLTNRSATAVLSTSQLALLDGRSLYQDFLGFIMWDFVPVNLSEIKQIEVIRGPASAVWGANAQTGVINIITKSPREMQGTTITTGVGAFGRSVDESEASLGMLFSMNGTHAQAVNERWAFKISGGVFSQDPFSRPTGVIPNQFQTPYPPIRNRGTTQPKVDGRVDYDFADGRQKLIVAAGLAGTEGLVESGFGPFRIRRGTTLGYTKVNYQRAALKINFFVNLLDGNAESLLARDVRGDPVFNEFKNQTYDVEIGHSQTIRAKHLLTYGGNIRHNRFDLSIAPLGRTRLEGGAYLQDEIFFSNRLQWVVGARVDKFDVIEAPVVSPRTALLIKPARLHTIRVSYNKAYRIPSLVTNYLELSTLNEINLASLGDPFPSIDYVFPTLAAGNIGLREESLTAYELGYTGVLSDRALVTAAFYVNQTKDEIFLTQVGSYSSANPPPGWPLPPAVLDALIAANAFGPGLGLPSLFTYRNLGSVRQKGLELGVEAKASATVSAFANYSWQPEPKPSFDVSEINLPPRHRYNVGVMVNQSRYFGNLSVSYTDSAFWQDVLDARFHGSTGAYTLVNGAFGIRWSNEKLVSAVKVTNLTNEVIQQHIFGDIMKRQVVGELRVSF
jgi:outer membrane receptor protein involved in Fe transport